MRLTITRAGLCDPPLFKMRGDKMIVDFYTTNKRINSLLTPDEASARRYSDIQIKSGCSIINPILEIGDGGFNPSDYNYLYIPAFKRYYWINDISWDRGVWNIRATVDVLGSFAADIKLHYAFIDRASSEHDGSIIDGLWPSKNQVATTVLNAASPITGVGPSSGMYVIGVINGSSGKRGALTYYGLSANGFNNVLSSLFSDNPFSDNLDEVTREVVKFVSNPSQYIRSCVWVPLASTGGASTVNLGYFDTGISGSNISNSVGQWVPATVTIPKHPQSERGSYLNRPPFTTATLYVPGAGSYSIDTSQMGSDDTTFNINYYIDVCTGAGHLRAGFGSGNPCIDVDCMFGVSMDIAGISQSSSSIGTVSLPGGLIATAAAGLAEAGEGILSTIGGAFGHPEFGAGLADGVQSVAGSACYEANYSSSGNGSFVNSLIDAVVVVKHQLICSDDNDNFGRPLYARRQIGNMDGFVKCGEFHYEAAGALAEEAAQIERYMMDGVFVE